MVSKTESPECQEKIGRIQPGIRSEVCLNVVHVHVILFMSKLRDRQMSTGTRWYSTKRDETRCKLEIYIWDTSWKVRAYGIYARVVDVSEIGRVSVVN